MSTSRGAIFPFLAILTSVLCLNLGTLWAKHSLFPLIGAQGTTALRVGLSALILVLFSRPWRGLPARSDLATIAVYGAALGAMNLAFYMALKTLPLGVAVALEFSGPLAVAMFSSRRPADIVWVLLAFGGIYILLPLEQHVSSLDPGGVAYAMVSAVLWAIYIVFAKRVGHLPTGQSVSLGLVVAALVVVPVGVANAGGSMISVSSIGLGLAVAALSSAIPISLEMGALHRLPKHVFGVMLSMEPAVAALMAFALFGEHLTLSQWLAVCLIVCASVGCTLTARH